MGQDLTARIPDQRRISTPHCGLASTSRGGMARSSAAPAIRAPGPGFAGWTARAPSSTRRDLGYAVASRQTTAQRSNFALRDAARQLAPLQSWPLACWPDGSLKWTAHALAPGAAIGQRSLRGDRAAIRRPSLRAVVTREGNRQRRRDRHRPFRVPHRAHRLATSSPRSRARARDALRDGKLVLLRQDRAASADDTRSRSRISRACWRNVTLEQRGPARAVVRLEGKHAARRISTRAGCPSRCGCISTPAVTRCACCTPSCSMATNRSDFIRGIGLRFTSPLTDAAPRPACAFRRRGRGLFGEAVRGLTGLRRDPGDAARAGADRGRAPCRRSRPRLEDLLQYIPAFGDWTLLQPNADSFTIRKRTADGHAWLDSAASGRAPAASDTSAGPTGGVAFGIRNFWQSHPAQLDIRGAQATRPPSPCGCGRRMRLPWTCASITTAWARTRTRSSTRVASRSPTRTTNRVSARRWAWRAPAS